MPGHEGDTSKIQFPDGQIVEIPHGERGEPDRLRAASVAASAIGKWREAKQK